jgi:hypothetical protein
MKVVFLTLLSNHETKAENEIFKEVKRVMKKDDHFILSVSNPYHFKELIWNLFKIKYPQGHIYSWTRQAMILLNDTK